MKREAYLRAITELYPDFPIQSADLQEEEGQYNDILIVNDEFIFRFPKYPEGVQGIQNEIRILSRIQGYTTLPIPDPIYTSKGEARPGKVFMGYRKLPGEPLWRETFRRIEDEDVLQRLATQLAGFLKELHGIPFERIGSDVPVQDSLAEMAELYAGIRAHIFDHMRPDARDWVIHHFEGYLESPHLHAYPRTLKHGDFGGSNILFDPESQRINGIIDFGSACVGDPAHDIAAVSTYGEAFLERFYSTYPEVETMVERANFYKSTFALSEALHGIKNGDESAFRAGMASFI